MAPRINEKLYSSLLLDDDLRELINLFPLVSSRNENGDLTEPLAFTSLDKRTISNSLNIQKDRLTDHSVTDEHNSRISSGFNSSSQMLNLDKQTIPNRVTLQQITRQSEDMFYREMPGTFIRKRNIQAPLSEEAQMSNKRAPVRTFNKSLPLKNTSKLSTTNTLKHQVSFKTPISNPDRNFSKQSYRSSSSSSRKQQPTSSKAKKQSRSQKNQSTFSHHNPKKQTTLPPSTIKSSIKQTNSLYFKELPVVPEQTRDYRSRVSSSEDNFSYSHIIDPSSSKTYSKVRQVKSSTTTFTDPIELNTEPVRFIHPFTTVTEPCVPIAEEISRMSEKSRGKLPLHYCFETNEFLHPLDKHPVALKFELKTPSHLEPSNSSPDIFDPTYHHPPTRKTLPARLGKWLKKKLTFSCLPIATLYF